MNHNSIITKTNRQHKPFVDEQRHRKQNYPPMFYATCTAGDYKVLATTLQDAMDQAETHARSFDTPRNWVYLRDFLD